MDTDLLLHFKPNGMLPHSLGGEVFFFFAALFAPALDLIPFLQAQGMMDCNKDIKF